MLVFRDYVSEMAKAGIETKSLRGGWVGCRYKDRILVSSANRICI